MTRTNSSTHGPFYLVVLQLIIASKLSELEQFENQATNYRIASRKGWKWEKIKLRLLQSFRKGVFWQGDVVLAVNFNFNGGFFSWILPKGAPICQKNEISMIFSSKKKIEQKQSILSRWLHSCVKFEKGDPTKLPC